MGAYRIERDCLGERKVPSEALHGIHTERALENFPLSGRPVHPELIHAYGAVKLAAVRTNRGLGVWKDAGEADAMEAACHQMMRGELDGHVRVDALQGGAGTSTNMSINEVLANRALALLGFSPGRYEVISPTEDLNRHQSTNDTYPTALRIAALRMLGALETRVVALQEGFQALEKKFSHVVKVGRTEMQDAVPITLGREMAAYAEALSRDRWRIYKCQERLRVVNLGGTAVGTGLGAPREYIFRVTETLREIVEGWFGGRGLARAENLVDATQNADVFVEVSGMLKAHAATLIKLSGDLRLMSSGPDAGFGEIVLPGRQAGSSLMPGKINPVIPEAVTQASMMVIGHDAALTMACASGSLELNPFMPLIAECLLDSLDLLAHANDILRRHCVEGISANEARCRMHVNTATATATVLVPVLGYEAATATATAAAREKRSLRATALELHPGLTEEAFDAMLTPEAVCRLGSPQIVTTRECVP